MNILKAMNVYHIRMTFTEDVLGTCSGNPELHDEYIASKAPDAMTRKEEVAAIGVGDAIEKGMTVFPRNSDGVPILWGYQVEGFLKESVKNIKKHWPDSECAKIKANKQTIDNAIFVYYKAIPYTESGKYDNSPRNVNGVYYDTSIPVDMNGGVVGDCQRPLRASTAQGERVALAHSESLPAGSSIEFYISLAPILGKGIDTKEVIQEMMDYAQLKGIGQWRNSGKGRAVWEYID